MSDPFFTIPARDRYFEDYAPGSVHEFGSILADEAEMLDFARRYDPQPMHVDPEGAKNTIYGGLIASGWYTASLMMRLYVDHYLPVEASLGSPGVDELRWLKPVRPGDHLSTRATILDATRSRSKPDRGIIHTQIEVMNQDREVVMTMKAVNFVLCRAPASAF